MASSHEDIERFVAQNWESIVEDIGTLVAIPSVRDDAAATPDAPWGPGPRQALDAALVIARRLGLEAHGCEGRIGYADVPGEGAGQVATIAHLDVVPAGSGWDFEPYRLTRCEGYLVGRGVLDDKGAVVLTLWAARYLATRGAHPRRGVRILLGTNEETGMGDALWYTQHYPAPDFVFTPDAAWPVVCGEKGFYSARVSWSRDPRGRIVKFEGGDVTNAVATTARATVRADAAALPDTRRVRVEPAGEGLACIEASGVGGHAASPQGTTSAIGVLVNYLLDQGVCTPAERGWLEFERLVFSSTDGSAFGIQATDDLFSPLTIISGTMRTEGDRFVQSLDCRYPKSTTPDRIERGISQTCQAHGVAFAEVRRGDYLYVDPQSPEIRALMGSYAEWYHDGAQPVTYGGGTYAKRFPHAVAFGPQEAPAADAPSWAGHIHGPNEAVSEASLRRALCVYIRALEQLAG